MRKSDYPEYFGGPRRSRGPRTLRHWFHCLEDYSIHLSKKRKRWLVCMWLMSDCPEFNFTDMRDGMSKA